MAAKRNSQRAQDVTDAPGKLTRLLETEQELDAMLKETRREAAALVEQARAEAEARVKRCELELEAAQNAVREQVVAERDQTIESIRDAAKRETNDLDELDEAKLAELARNVVQLLVAGFESGGSS